MKNNQPVTQREVSFPPDHYLVSKTDLKGVITYCNDAFVVRPEQPVSPDGEAMGFQIRRLHAAGLGDTDA